MRKKIVAGNWKMNTTPSEGVELLVDIIEGLDSRKDLQTNVVVAPPFTHLDALIETAWETADISIAAQNCHQNAFGAFTGEVSAEMLADMDVDAVILGHSERRQYFKESNAQLKEKVTAALKAEMVVIFCVGESLEERENNQHFEVVNTQIKEALVGLSPEEWENIVIAYEPVWAIGTGKTASPAQAQEMHASIRNFLKLQIGDLANEISILYGGSCNPKNADELFSQPDVDGGLIGGASLKAPDFLSIIDSLEKTH